MSALTMTLQESLEAQREIEWRRAGVSAGDIQFSRTSGMDGRDIRAIRDYSRRGFIIIVRCPNVAARGWHGILPAKNAATSAKSGPWGVVLDDKNRMMVSDYDLMGVWRMTATGAEKIFISAAGGQKRGAYSRQAQTFLLEMNRQLVTKFQHGCQDDFKNQNNRGVRVGDHFAAFAAGQVTLIKVATELKFFYARHRLEWPYNAHGNLRQDS
jgi:hypothetical protein